MREAWLKMVNGRSGVMESLSMAISKARWAKTVPVPVPTLQDIKDSKEFQNLQRRVEALEQRISVLFDATEQESAIDDGRPKRPTMALIQEFIANEYNIPVLEMQSSRRANPVVRPRQIAMYLCTKLTIRTLPQIGRAFGGRDHTTVLHARNKIAGDRASSLEFDAKLAEFERRLGGG